MVLSDPAPFPRGDDKSIIEQVELARGGNEIAFDTLYRHFFIPIYKYLFRLVNNREDAEELAQETFVKAWDKLPSLRNCELFKSWLYRIATNVANDRFRQRRFVWVGEVFSEQGTERAIEDRVEEKELVNLALKKVPEKLRECLLLHLEGFSHQEIAGVLDLAVKSVGTYISQARVIFRQAYLELRSQ